MKKILIIASITIVCLLAIYIYLTTSNGFYCGRMHHRYNKVITAPLARMNVVNAQYTMWLYYAAGADEYESLDEPEKAKKEYIEALSWLNIAATNGSKKAIETLKMLEKSNKEE